MAKPGSNAPPVNGDQVRDTWFWWPVHEIPGYNAPEVDDLVARVAAELDAGRPAGPVIENATLRWQKWRRRYDIDSVDWFLGQFLRPPGQIGLAGSSDDPWADLPVTQLAPGGVSHTGRYQGKPTRQESRAYFAEQCENAWRDFGRAPGTNLWWGSAGRGVNELRTAERRTLASVRGRLHKTYSTDGKSFTLRQTSARSPSPGLAELVARVDRDPFGHFARLTLLRGVLASPGVREPDQDLVDETGVPILSIIEPNFEWRARARILFPDERWLRFPVRGTRRENAIMTAVDQAGNRVARYRYRIIDKFVDPEQKITGGPSISVVEITLHPGCKLTDELALVLAISAGWLSNYFERPSGGG